MSEEPLMDVAHLGHLELLTPKPEESLRFFIDVMGMTESGRKGNSVYLRAFDDYERYSLQLTASHTSGLGHAAFRARSPQALQRRVQALEGVGPASAGMRANWGTAPPIVSTIRTGMSSSFTTRPQWYEAPQALRPALKNQAQRFPARGVNVRRLDHFNCLAVDVRANREFFQEYLGFRLTEQIVLDSGEEAGMWLTATNKSYDFAYTKEAHGVKGASITSLMRSTAARMFFARPISFSKPASRSKPGRISTPCSKPFFFTSSSLAGTASRSPMPAHALCSRPIGSRSDGPRPSGRRGRPGASRPSRASTRTAHRPCPISSRRKRAAVQGRRSLRDAPPSICIMRLAARPLRKPHL